jgi:putative hemolysin
MGDVSTELIVISFLIFLNGIFSMSEMAIVSARKNRLQERAELGNRGAQTALELADNPNRFLSTVQIGITLIGILSGAFGGATLSDEIGRFLARSSWLEPYSKGIGVGVVVLIITYFSLVLGELVPKRIALNNAEGVALRVARPMRWISTFTTPLVSLLSFSTELFLKVIGSRPSEDLAVTEEDVQSMIDQGTALGVFEESEQEMITQVFRLADRRVSTVMTPRPSIIFINDVDEQANILEMISQSGYSRFPMFSGTFDNILGIIQVKDLFQRMITGKALDLKEVLQPPLYIPESMTALEVLERFKETGSEMGLIIDEYGGLIGLVTLNDIMEAIVGDVEVAQAGEDPEIMRREDGSFLVGGMVLLEDLRDILEIRSFPDEEKGYYETLGGMIMTQLGKIPEAGDLYEWEGYTFEVVDMDSRRVDKVLVKRI